MLDAVPLQDLDQPPQRPGPPLGHAHRRIHRRPDHPARQRPMTPLLANPRTGQDLGLPGIVGRPRWWITQISQYPGDMLVDILCCAGWQKMIVQSRYSPSVVSTNTFTNSSNASRSSGDSGDVGSERAANLKAAPETDDRAVTNPATCSKREAGSFSTWAI